MKSLLPAAIVSCMLLLINSSQANAQRFFEFGGGFSPWSESHVAGATTEKTPFHAYVEYGNFLQHYSISARYDFSSQYQLENYELNPWFFGLFLNRKLLSFGSYRYEVEVIGGAGLLLEQHRFLDRGNNQVPGYELEEERASGPGFAGRFGAKLLVGKFVGSLFLEMFRSQQDFTAGQFEQQTFQTGSNRLTLSIGYRLNRENNEVTCPTYF